ncbi:VanW family protein [Nocardioidaceae bacterium]|nr:VanW family protein [Nocardioidaceae bacterium]
MNATGPDDEHAADDRPDERSRGVGGDDFGDPASGPERSGAGAALAVLVAVVLVAGAGYVWAVLNAGDRIAPGTTVAGVDVGGVQPAAAELTLRNGLATRASEDVELTVAGAQVLRSPSSLGLSVDYAATVDQAAGGSRWLPANLWDFYTGGTSLDAVVDVDRATLLPFLDDVVADAEQAPVEGEVLISGADYEVVEPVEGTRLDRVQAVATLRSQWLDADVVELPLEPALPDIDADDVRRAVTQIAEPVVSGPVRLRVGQDVVRLAPRDYTDLVSLTPVQGRLELAVNEERLPLRVSLALSQADLLDAGRDAQLDVVDGRVEIEPAVVGQRVVTEPLVLRFRQATLAADVADRVLRVPLQRRRPELTTAAAEQLEITEQLAEVQIPYASAPFRDTNLARGAEELDGTLIEAGESLSFNETIGPPTPERGFVEGVRYDDGQTYAGVGAGLSRLASALASAAWQSALDLQERSPMPWHPEEYPIGVDAAVQFGVTDLVVANPSPYGVLVTAEVAEGGNRAVTVSLWSTTWREVRTSLSAFTDQESPASEFVSTEGCVGVAGQPGFDVTATRTLLRPGGGAQVRTDDLEASYRPLPNIVCVNP